MILAAGNAANGATYQFIDENCPAHNCYYRLEEVRLDGSSSFYKPTMVSSTTTADENLTIPFTFGLQQNYPNPFNPNTTISYSLPNAVDVQMGIYNLNGRLVKQLVAEQQDRGYYDVTWDGTDAFGYHVVSGTYIYRLQAGEQSVVRKMVLMR